jgi:Tfp pilus assembly protein PilN
MYPVIVSVLAALAGLAAQGFALAGLVARLRWRERQQREHRAYLTALARELPRGCQLDEVRADGSTLHLVIAHVAELTERPSR